MVYGFVLIALVVLGARKVGYDWTTGEPGLRGGMILFVVALVLQALAATVSGVDAARNFAALGAIAAAIGWLQVVRGVFAIGRKPAG